MNLLTHTRWGVRLGKWENWIRSQLVYSRPLCQTSGKQCQWAQVGGAWKQLALRWFSGVPLEGPAQRLGLPTPVCWWLQLRALERLQGAAPQGGPDRAPEALRHTPPETPAPEGASSPSVRRLYLAWSCPWLLAWEAEPTNRGGLQKRLLISLLTLGHRGSAVYKLLTPTLHAQDLSKASIWGETETRLKSTLRLNLWYDLKMSKSREGKGRFYTYDRK